MFDYLLVEEKSLKLFANERFKSLKVGLSSYLQELAQKNLMNLKVYFKNCQKVLSLKRKIPICFNEQLCLFYLKTRKNSLYYINWFAVAGICEWKEEIRIVFKDSTELSLKISPKSVLNQITSVKLVLGYLGL